MKTIFSLMSVPLCSVMFAGLLSFPSLAHSQYYFEASPYYDRYGNFLYDTYDEDGVVTDNELRVRVMTDLAISPFVDRDDIFVKVKNGVVTLSGSVEDRSEMIDAVEISYDAGARRVRNKLSLRERGDGGWAHMTDRELTEEIKHELIMSPFVNADHITVSVKGGVATLYGWVENKGEIADAVENAYEAGARRVMSRLWVDPELS